MEKEAFDESQMSDSKPGKRDGSSGGFAADCGVRALAAILH
jgi:hypothetical protein